MEITDNEATAHKLAEAEKLITKLVEAAEAMLDETEN